MSREGESTPQPDQRCCLGLLYYSHVREEQGKRPVCLGFPHTPTEPVHIEGSRRVADVTDFKFFCLGQSLYERPVVAREGAAADGQIKRAMPYCEGLEVTFAAATDDLMTKTAAASSAMASSTAGASSVPARLQPGSQQPPQQQPDELTAVMTSIFGGEDSPIVKGAAKFNKVAQRNFERMRSTASQMYGMTLKPLIDKLSGDQ